MLQEYDLKWEYIPGKKNVVADVLSRIDINKQTFEGEKESILKVYHIPVYYTHLDVYKRQVDGQPKRHRELPTI